MPIVRLRSLATGGEAIFVKVHNLADTARFPGQERFRLDATRREVVTMNVLLAAYDVPIHLTGDFNARKSAFCTFTRGGALTASAGGRTPRGTGRITDHPLVVASATDTAVGGE